MKENDPLIQKIKEQQFKIKEDVKLKTKEPNNSYLILIVSVLLGLSVIIGLINTLP